MTATLSPRESEIVELLGNGLADKQIMEKLKITRGTLRTHLVRACRKWTATNRTHLVKLCLAAEFKAQLEARLSERIATKRMTTAVSGSVKP